MCINEFVIVNEETEEMDCIPGPFIRGDAQADFGRKNIQITWQKELAKKGRSFCYIYPFKSCI